DSSSPRGVLEVPVSGFWESETAATAAVFRLENQKSAAEIRLREWWSEYDLLILARRQRFSPEKRGGPTWSPKKLEALGCRCWRAEEGDKVAANSYLNKSSDTAREGEA
ncbi:hypothetical protein U1Q18_003917, partial [Sarracenia purpurea var. burkii]